jgi:hypothetical protein
MAKRVLPPAPHKVVVNVTDEVIAKSVPRDSGHCMVADAVKLAYPNAQHISVDIQTIRFSDPTKGLRYTYLTPRTAQVSLVEFDMGTHPEPFSFQLRNGHTTSMKRVNPETGKATKRGTGSKGVNVMKSMSSAGGDGVPRVVGGTLPPTGALAAGKNIPAGRRRAFGMRAMDNYR